jgi:hypothetical protein
MIWFWTCEKNMPPPLSQIEPILDVPEQVIGLIAGRKFDNGKGLAWRGLIIKRKMCGVSDGFRRTHLGNPAPSAILQGVVAEL